MAVISPYKAQVSQVVVRCSSWQRHALPGCSMDLWPFYLAVSCWAHQPVTRASCGAAHHSILLVMHGCLCRISSLQDSAGWKSAMEGAAFIATANPFDSMPTSLPQPVASRSLALPLCRVRPVQVKLLREKFKMALGDEMAKMVDINTIDGFQVHGLPEKLCCYSGLLLLPCTSECARAVDLLAQVTTFINVIKSHWLSHGAVHNEGSQLGTAAAP